jgi:hypothetical protein
MFPAKFVVELPKFLLASRREGQPSAARGKLLR